MSARICYTFQMGKIGKSILTTERILMHKDVEAMALQFEANTGRVHKVTDVMDEAHAPLAYQRDLPEQRRRQLLTPSMRTWAAITKYMPDNRVGVQNFEHEFGLTREQMALNARWMSPSDQYWLREPGEHATHSELNFFENRKDSASASVFMGEFGQGLERDDIEVSAVPSTNGRMLKSWIYIGGKLHLMKSDEVQQGVLNEEIGTFVNQEFGFPHVEYKTTFHMDQAAGLARPYSRCMAFTDKDTDFVPANSIMSVLKRSSNESELQHYLRCCEFLGIKPCAAQSALSRFALVDSIICNQDRHPGNFGHLRDADTLEFGKSVPYFDADQALWAHNEAGFRNGFYAPNGYGNSVDTLHNPLSGCFKSKLNDTLELMVRSDKGTTFSEGLSVLPRLRKTLPEFAHETLKKSDISTGRLETVIRGLKLRMDVTESIIKKNI